MDVRLRIELLGGLRVAAAEREITPFRRPKVAALFAYLAFYRHRPHPREELIELLWPEIDPEAGRNNLRVTLHLLRQQLAESGLPPERLLLTQHSTLRLRPEACTTDVAEFEAALQAARAAQAAERGRPLADAVALYRGELLPGFVEPWVLMERQPLAEAYQEALQQLIGVLEETGDFEGAKEQARRAVSADPLREEAHYDLMRLYAATSQPDAALRQYEELERLLRAELGETPSAATRALAEELRESARTLLVPRAARARVVRPWRDPSKVTPGALPGSDALAAAGLSARGHPPRRGERQRADPGDTDVGGANWAPPTDLPGLPRPRLPVQFTRFYGREEEIAWLTDVLRIPAGTHEAGGRLVTLTGPGGSGKTRLAVAVAGRLEAEFEGRGPGGPWFVPLAELTEAHLIPDAIISALGLARAGSMDPWEQVVAVLQGQRSLLVLDNFEQLAEAGAPLLRELLERVPALTCLVTSRRRLELEGELECLVLPLPTPSNFGFRILDFGLPAEPNAPKGQGSLSDPIQNPNAQTRPPASLRSCSPRFAPPPEIQNPEAILRYPSVALFVDRAQAARPGFALTRENAAVVAELCDRLEGLPLAIELAAARTGVLTPEQMLARLASTDGHPRTGSKGGRFELLVSRRRDASSRHRSLRAAIDWSYRLLPSELQSFFARLSIFRGGWTLEAAEAVCQTPGALDYLEELRHASLVHAEEAPQTQGTAMRYRLLEMLREYAGEQLSPEEREVLAGRHARFFLELAEEAELALQGAQPGEWLDRLEQEHDNLRAALDWCLGSGVRAFGRSGVQEEQGLSTEPERPNVRTPERLTWGLRLATALSRFWFTRGFIREGRARLTTALVRITGATETTAPGAMAGRHPVDIDFRLWARALDAAGNLALGQSDFETARALYEQHLALSEQHDDPRGVLETLTCLGVVAICEGSLDVARSFYERSLALAEQLDDRQSMAQSLSGLGGIAELEGNYALAGSFLERSVPLAREVGPWGGLAWALHAWGFVTWQQGDLEAGRALLEESLALFREAGHRYGLARTLERLAGLALAQRQPERATRLCGAAAHLREMIGSPLGPLGQAELDRDVAATREALGEPAFARAWAEGAAMTLEQALHYATGPGIPPAS